MYFTLSSRTQMNTMHRSLSGRHRHRCIPILAICLSVALVSTSPIFGDDPRQESQSTSLFNGSTLDGWSGDTRFWSVENGAITGKTTAEQPLDANTFLIWRAGELEDFELSTKFRIEGGNSGIQYRSQDLGDFHVGGYQADIDGDHTYIGILYDEQGRGILANRCARVEIDAAGQNKVVGTTCDEAALLASIKANEWSEYTVTARGNHLTQVINGFVTVDVVDGQVDQAENRGILALQIHTGPPMKVQFKDIQLRRLNTVEPSPAIGVAPPIAICCPTSDCCDRYSSRSHCCPRRPILGLFFRR
jgi:3-keto-disaccharide hydrolase